jgi:exonuclease VII small subunit
MGNTRLDRIAERLDHIEGRLDRVEAGQTRLESGQAQLESGQAKLESGQAKLESGQAKLESGQDELRRHMYVLHEDVIDRIKAIPTDGPTKAEMKQGFDELREVIGRRLDPLEAAVRRLITG